MFDMKWIFLSFSMSESFSIYRNCIKELRKPFVRVTIGIDDMFSCWLMILTNNLNTSQSSIWAEIVTDDVSRIRTRRLSFELFSKDKLAFCYRSISNIISCDMDVTFVYKESTLNTQIQKSSKNQSINQSWKANESFWISQRFCP